MNEGGARTKALFVLALRGRSSSKCIFAIDLSLLRHPHGSAHEAAITARAGRKTSKLKDFGMISDRSGQPRMTKGICHSTGITVALCQRANLFTKRIEKSESS